MFALRRIATRNIFAVSKNVAAFTPRMFSTSVQKNLLQTVESEIKNEGPAEFPTKDVSDFLADNKDWKFEHNGAELKLTRSTDGFDVKVEWRAMNMQAEDSAMGSMFEVTASKPGKGSLVFYCETIPAPAEGEQQQEDMGNMWVQNVRYLAEGQSAEDAAAYEGPSFMDLEEAFQENMDAFLTRLLGGNTEELTDFIEYAAMDKEQALYCAWLNDIKNFVA